MPYNNDYMFQGGIDAPMLFGMDDDQARQQQLFKFLQGIQSSGSSMMGTPSANQIGYSRNIIPSTGRTAPLVPIQAVNQSQMANYAQQNPSPSVKSIMDLIEQTDNKPIIQAPVIPPATAPATATNTGGAGATGDMRSRADVNSMYDMILQKILGMSPYQHQPTALPELALHEFLGQGRY